MTPLPEGAMVVPAAEATDSRLLGWIFEPRSDHEVRFFGDERGWGRTSYDELAAMTKGAAAQFADHGVRSGAVVAIILPTGPEFIAAFYGAILLGATACPITPPGYFNQRTAYRDHLARVLRVAKPRVVVSHPMLMQTAEEAIAQSGIETDPFLAFFRMDVDIEPAPPAETALLQFTSGSTGHPRGARVSWDSLEAHTRMATDWLGYDGSESAAMWLPLYHDMGLTGCLLCGISRQGTLHWMRPDQFVRDPLTWIACFGRERATLTAAPPFAFVYVTKRVPEEELRGMDFSGWRSAVMGAERIDAHALQVFADRFERYGFDPATFTPAYGLAEATLAVTLSASYERPTAARVDWRSMRFGEPVDLELGTLEAAERSGRPSEWLVGCGRPLGDLKVTIVGEGGEPLPGHHLGEIVVEGPTLASGYEGMDPEDGPFVNGALHTGDAGFFADDQLYVLGRIGDMLSVRGRNVYVEDLEARLGDLDGVRKGRFVVVAGPTEVVALVESEPGPWVDDVKKVLHRHVGGAYNVTVACGGRGAIERTSSGKPRRRAMWHSYSDGTLACAVVASSRTS